MENKRLYRSNDRKLFGVCGGIAEYLNFDPTIIRIIWVMLVLTFGTGILLYLVAALLMGNRPDYVSRFDNK